MEDVAAAQDVLLLESKLFVTDRTGLFVVESLERGLFNVLPLLLAERQLRLVNEAEPLCKREVLDVLNALLLDVKVSTLVL